MKMYEVGDPPYYKVVTLPQETLYTCGASSCIVVTILNRATGQLGMCHASGMAVTPDPLHDLLCDLDHHPGDDIVIHVCGGCSKEFPKEAQADRDFVLDALAKEFSSYAMTIEWNNEGGYSFNVGVRADGSMYVNRTSDDELLLEG